MHVARPRQILFKTRLGADSLQQGKTVANADFKKKDRRWLIRLIHLIVPVLWGAACWFAWTQPPRADTQARNYPLNPLSPEFWHHSALVEDFWKYPIERDPNLRLPSVSAEFRDVHFFDAKRGWAVGDRGAILATSDGGVSWAEQFSSTQDALQGVHFANPKRGWVVGDGGVILTTDDGGKSWTAQLTGTSNGLNGIHFLDEERGWVVGADGTVLRTDNGGTNWQVTPSGVQGSLYGLHFVDEKNGWVVGESGTILHTEDGGASWQSQSTDSKQWLYGVSFVDVDQGWIVGAGGLILSTLDGGVHWHTQSSDTSKDLYGVFFADARRGWAGGRGGLILATSDAGKNWRVQNGGLTSVLTGIQFVDAKRGWAVGLGGTILATSDGGARWRTQTRTKVHDQSLFLSGVDFIDSTRGWVVSGEGAVLRTDDGGVTWRNQLSGANNGFADLDFVDSKYGWAVGDGGTVLATRDGGVIWKAQRSGTEKYLRSVYFVDSQIGWVVGNDATILSTMDGGANWQAQTTSATVGLGGVHFADRRRGWVVGYNGTILATSDGGGTWQVQKSGTTNHLYDLFFVDALRGWAVGLLGTILVTADGGANWKAQETGTDYPIIQVYFVDSRRGWAVGYYGTILQTSDGGGTWNVSASKVSSTLSSVSFSDERNGWVVGFQGTILRTSDGGASWVQQSGDTSRTFSDVYFADALHGWVVGSSGTIMMSRDGGVSWHSQDSGAITDLYDVHFVDTKQGWVVGGEGTVLVTDDGGENWREVNWDYLWDKNLLAVFPGNEDTWIVGGDGYSARLDNNSTHVTTRSGGEEKDFAGVHFVDRQHGWIVGDAGTILSTGDRGETWLSQKSRVPNGLTDVQFLDGQNGWVVGRRGVVLRTVNGGTTWTQQSSGTRAELSSIHFVNTRRGWVAGDGGTILATTDGGSTWHAQASGTNQNISGLHFFDAKSGWAVGGSGFVLRTVDGGSHWTRSYEARFVRWPAPWFLLLTLTLLFVGLVSQFRPLSLGGLDQVGSSDAPRSSFSDDRINTAPRVLALSRVLRNERTRPPLVVAVDGEWGEGKSSLMRMLQSDLGYHGARTAWFNAWHHQTDEHLLAALLDTIRRELPTSWSPALWRYRWRLFKRRAFRKPLRTALSIVVFFALTTVVLKGQTESSGGQSTRLERITLTFACAMVGKGCENGLPDSPNPGAGEGVPKGMGAFGDLPPATLSKAAPWSEGEQDRVPWLRVVAALLSSVPLLALNGNLTAFPNPSALKGTDGWLRGRADARETSYRFRFAEDFRDVTHALLPYRLYVFIDDLDRCSPATTASLLEAVNFLCESGDVVVVLGIARETVERSLGLAYEKLAEESEDSAGDAKAKRKNFAEKFLRKLVNLRIRVPPVDPPAAAALLADDVPENKTRRLVVPGHLLWGDQLIRQFGKLAWWGVMAGGVMAGLFLASPPEIAETKSRPQSQIPVVLGTAFSQALDGLPLAKPDQVAPRVAEAQDAPISRVAIDSSAGPVRPREVLAAIAAFTVLFGLIVWLNRRRLSRFNTTDTQDLLWALEAWSPVLQQVQKTPRELRRFQNRLRHLFASLNSPPGIPLLKEPPGPLARAWYRRTLYRQEQELLIRSSYEVPGSLLVAMLSLFAIAQDAAGWEGFMRELLSGETWLKRCQDLDDPEEHDPVVKARVLRERAGRLRFDDAASALLTERIKKLPLIEAQDAASLTQEILCAALVHKILARSDGRLSLDRLKNSDPSVDTLWFKVGAHYDELYGKPRDRSRVAAA